MHYTEVNYILLFLSIVLVNNVITSQFLGICPFLGVSKKVKMLFFLQYWLLTELLKVR